MKTQKWMLVASIILFLGAAALVAFTILTPFAWAQGPMGWGGRGDGPMFEGGFGPHPGMGWGHGMMSEGGFGMGPGGGMRGGHRGGPGNSLMAVAAETLGLTPAELVTELQAGKTVVEVAAEKNVDVDTIVEAILAPRTERLNELVTAGQLTQAEIEARLTILRVDVIERLNQRWDSKNAAPDVEPGESDTN